MPNHPNRPGSAAAASRKPTPAEVRQARTAAGLTQTEAGMLIHTTQRVWAQWEAGDRSMHPAFWELFKRKVSEKDEGVA